MRSNNPGSDDLGRLGHTLRSLRHRNYRLYFMGQGISLIGTWMQTVTLSWLVFQLTHNPLLLGEVAFASQIPAFLFTPFGGAAADRVNRRRLLILTQTLAMLQALLLSILVLTGTIRVWEILALSVFVGLVNAFDMPTRQAFVVQLTANREDLANAIALNSSMFNGARLIGPSIAGVLISLVGEGLCFLINAISYLAVIASLFAMRISPKPAERQSRPMGKGLRDGFVYAYGSLPIRYILMLLSLMSLVGMPYTILMPIFAKTILHGGASTLGFLMAASGVGALIGALYLASRRSVLGLAKWISIGAAMFGSGLVMFSFSRVLWLSMLLLVFTGFGMMVQMASSNTIIQTIVEEDKRGRVMSFYTMSFMGAAPFGSLIAGAVAKTIGPQHTVMIGGILCIFGSMLFASKLPLLREIVHPIYVRMGIVGGISPGLGAAEHYAPPMDEDQDS